MIGERAPSLFGFGGNIWALPEVFPIGVSTRILSQHALGVTRLSLGTQVLQHATSLQDLRQRLAGLPVNAFLSEYKTKGGRILLSLDGTPRWLSRNKSTARVVGPDEPAFNLRPPQNFAEWSDVVEAIVRHFNGTLRLNAYYEIRNEPNYFYYGSNEQFFKQYYYSVLGARRADPAALIGGPGISEFTGVATAGESSRSDADKRRLVEYALGHRFLFRQFLDYAANTPLRELGLPRLPVDFLSWHAFYIDPSRYYGEDEQRADARRALPALPFVISGLGLPKRVTRYLIDATHANVYPQLDSATRILDAETASYSGLPA